MIKTLDKTIEILDILKETTGGCSLVHIHKSLGMPKSTVHGILKTLIKHMFVSKDEDTHLYKLGPGLITLGKKASLEVKIQKIAHPILKDLSYETGVDSFLMIPIGYKGIILEKIEGNENIKIVEKFGNEFYLHLGATRKAILAYKPKEFIDDYIKIIINNCKRKNHITESELLLNVSQIKENGVAVSHGDYAKGTIGIGAPVFNSLGEVIASVGINILETPSIDDNKIKSLMKIVKEKAMEISKCMGYFKGI